MIRFHKGRVPLFSFVGGINGLLLFLILIAIWFVWRRQDVWPNREEIFVLAILSTIPFCYGTTWGVFTALDMGRCDKQYMR